MPHYDLVIVGAGSGNMLLDERLASWRTAIIEPDRFGGTCLNRGCIPSKMFVYAADVARHVRHAGRYGIAARVDHVDWPAIRDRVFGRIDPIHDDAVAYRRRTGTDVYLDAARFVAPRVLDVGGVEVSADRVVVAAGSRPWIPPIPGIDEVPYHTSDTIMRLDRLPASMLIVGGGFIAAEMGHVFDAFGTRVTIVQRGAQMLNGHDHDIARRFTELARDRYEAVHVSSAVERLESRPGGVAAHVVDAEGRRSTVEVETVLIAAGRVPNTDLLDVAAGGLTVDDHGHLVSDDHGATPVEGVWALGDISNHFQLKHVANAESRTVLHNVLHPERPRPTDLRVVPSAVFSDPQVASVGATEQALVAAGRPYRVATRDYASTAYGWALEDTTSFVKVLADPVDGTLLGAHVIGPQASVVVQPLIQAMALGTPVRSVAREVFYIHPALSEVVENALLDLDLDLDLDVEGDPGDPGDPA